MLLINNSYHGSKPKRWWIIFNIWKLSKPWWSSKTTDFLDKSTWTLASILILLVLLSSLSFSGDLSDNNSKLIDDTTPAKPAVTTPAPAKPATETTTPVTEPVATPENK